jgi:hypothetical protein
MELILGVILGALAVPVVQVYLKQHRRQTPPEPDETVRRRRRENRNFLHYNGDTQEGE